MKLISLYCAVHPPSESLLGKNTIYYNQPGGTRGPEGGSYAPPPQHISASTEAKHFYFSKYPLLSALDWCIQQQSGLMLLGRWSIGDLPAGIPFLAFSKCKQKNMDMRKRNTYAHPTVSNIFDNWKMVFCYKNCSDLQ